MFKVLSSIWALLVGIVLIMLGNGMHFTLIGLRGGLEGFSATALAVVTSGYFVGFLSGARFAPSLIHNVGHVRGLRGARQLHVGRTDRLPASRGALGMDLAKNSDRLLHVGRLRDGRKLAQRRSDQRDTRQSAVGLHDRADARDYRCARAPDAWGRPDVGAVHRRVDPGLDLVRADPLDCRPGASHRGHAADAAAPAVCSIAARHDRHISSGKRLCDAIGHGGRLRHADRDDDVPDLSVRGDAVRPALSSCNTRSAGFPTVSIDVS